MDRAKAKKIALRIVRHGLRLKNPVQWLEGEYRSKIINRDFYARVIVTSEGVTTVPYEP